MLLGKEILTQGEKILRLRKILDARQQDLVANSDITREMISRIEHGKNNLVPKTALIIASNMNRIAQENNIVIDTITDEFLLEDENSQAESIIKSNIKEFILLQNMKDSEAALNKLIDEINYNLERYEISGATVYKFYNVLAMYYSNKYCYDECYNCLLKCRDIANSLLDHKLVVNTYLDFIRLYNNQERYTECVNIGEYVLSYAKSNHINEYNLIVPILFNVAKAYRNIKDIENCLRLLNILEQDYDISYEKIADIKALKANCYYVNKDYAESIKLHEEVLEVSLRYGNMNMVAITYRNIAENYLELGNLELAEDYLYLCLNIDAKIAPDCLYSIYEFANKLAIECKREFLVVKGYYERMVQAGEVANSYNSLYKYIARMIDYCNDIKNYDYLKKIICYMMEENNIIKYKKDAIINFFYTTSFYMKSVDNELSDELQAEGMKYIKNWIN